MILTSCLGMFSSSPYSVGKPPHMPVPTIPGEPRQLPAPEAFSRPINAANPFTFFDMAKIQGMEEIYERAPKMPMVLTTHDIYPDDWKRCMQVCVSSHFISYPSITLGAFFRIWVALGLVSSQSQAREKTDNHQGGPLSQQT